MSALTVASDVLLVAGAAVLLLAAVGLVVRRDTRDRIHYAALAAVVGAPMMVVALALTAGGVRSAVKLLIIGALLAGTGPALSTATGHAVERARGDRGEGAGG
ncbi:monovalent cation/H(+) antiporter subunit G [Nocardioides sp. KR10-350]|uniref:monovalent cation/H(+) antiporter subunit G n=1 Tax=Nocardioides cheoyonin TaxID=3156615 RepID=UPI0032B34461